MNLDTPLDYALFQLSPRRSRCELLVSGNGKTEKLASGFFKPFATHLRVAEEEASRASLSIKLEIEKRRNAGDWFNKGTVERFVRFVSTPEVLELVNTFDAEMSQLEGARKIYSQGAGDQVLGSSGENETTTAAAADITKKELLRAIDVRLVAVKQDLTMAFARASAAGFTLDNVSELWSFADHFGANRLNVACNKFISLCQRRPELLKHQHQTSLWKGIEDGNIRSSSDSDMSIDEPEVDVGGPIKQSNKPNNGRKPPESVQQATADPQMLQQPKVILQMEKPTEEPASTAPADSSQPAGGGGSRRLSVQDRINLFESKQKELSASTNSINCGSGGSSTNRVASGKTELRRMSSDVHVEKSVLRRWSGASDMSIDFSNSESKESGSAASTPSSSANCQSQSGISHEIRESGGLKDSATSQSSLGSKDYVPGTPSFLASHVQSGPPPKGIGHEVVLKEKTASHDGQSKQHIGNDWGHTHTDFGASSSKAEHGELGAPFASRIQLKAFPNTVEGACPKEIGGQEPAALQNPSTAVSVVMEQFGQKDQEGSDSEPGSLQTGFSVGEDRPTTVTQLKAFPHSKEVGGKLKGHPNSRLKNKGSKINAEENVLRSDLVTSQSEWKSSIKLEDVKKESAEGECTGIQDIRSHRKPSPDQIRSTHGSNVAKKPTQGNAVPAFSRKMNNVGVESFNPPSTSLEQVQMIRPSKGNQELNDELQMKANELEKLFATHKLRATGDQLGSSRRSKQAEDNVHKTFEKQLKSISDQPFDKNLGPESTNNVVEFDANLLLKMVDNQDYIKNMKQKLGSLSPSDEHRGKLYEKYMQKRDAKLREDWGSKRAQTEAKMKAMNESLERSQAEMRSKFAGSANKWDSSHAHRRAEKLRFFSSHSNMKSNDQMLGSFEGEDEEDAELSDQDKAYNDGSFADLPSMKHPSSRTLSSSTLRTSGAQVSRSSIRGTNSCSTRRKAQSENSLAQSVPNFSDLRKENTKPLTAGVKGNNRVQSRITRSKSINDETNHANEEKPHRSQSMRKSVVIPGEMKDVSPLNSDSSNMTQSKLSKNQTEQIIINKFQKGGESKTFLRRGSGIGTGAGTGLGKLKASMSPELLEKGEDSDTVVDQQELSGDVARSEEEFERTSMDGNGGTIDFPADFGSEKPRLSQDSGNSHDPGSDNIDILRSPSQADADPVSLSSKFDISGRNLQESPGESPRSWNSRTHRSFSYAQETSDFDASVDSLTGSPASWNSHPLNQMMETDTARMRKKWGSAQIPVLVANASHQSRKDVTKGFKRLLKFGRKSRGTDSLLPDWVSASTASEGDDDTEDGRDLGTRLPDDLRKSRMGYSISSYDGFNEGEVFPEQVQSLRSSIPTPPANFKLREDHLSGSSLKAPRSFFSLSTFRSKGSESKLR